MFRSRTPRGMSRRHFMEHLAGASSLVVPALSLTNSLQAQAETLQQNRMVTKIREILTRKLLDQFLSLAKENPEEYKTFWNTYQRILKEGYQDFANREKVQELLRFSSSHKENDEDIIGLADYVEEMPVAQKAIYYLSGPSREALERDPRLEMFRKKS